jgi:hypothetical protein
MVTRKAENPMLVQTAVASGPAAAPLPECLHLMPLCKFVNRVFCTKATMSAPTLEAIK